MINVEYGVFVPMDEESPTEKAYEEVRKLLFISYGYNVINYLGQINNQALLALIITSEFAEKEGTLAFDESLEALSRQYWSEAGDKYTPCYGCCSLSEQLVWLKDIQGFRDKDLLKDISNGVWENYYGYADLVASQDFKVGSTRESWAWGNVDHDSQMMLWINEGEGIGSKYVVSNGDYVVLTAVQNITMRNNKWHGGTGPYWGSK